MHCRPILAQTCTYRIHCFPDLAQELCDSHRAQHQSEEEQRSQEQGSTGTRETRGGESEETSRGIHQVRVIVCMCMCVCVCVSHWASGQTTSSSFIYHRRILSTLCVGAMLWSMTRLRRGQVLMVVCVLGSC